MDTAPTPNDSPKAMLCVVLGTGALLALTVLVWALYGIGAAGLLLLSALIFAGSLLAAEHYSDERERRTRDAHTGMVVGRAYDAGYAAARGERA